MYKIVALIGEAGTGKDTIMQHLLIKKPTLFNEIISCTTRPPREGEYDGVNYYFLTKEQFIQKILDYEMLEITNFNNWFYGTSYSSLRSDSLNLGIFNPGGIQTIIETIPDVKVKVFRITCSDKTRLLRQLNREKNPNVEEIIRRYSTDKKDFSNLDFDYIEIENENKEDLERAVQEIIAQVEYSGS